jgi:hypothetical protein
VNLTANANVILTTGCNQWDRGLDIVVEGEAVQVTDDELAQTTSRGLEDKVGRTVAIPGE